MKPSVYLETTIVSSWGKKPMSRDTIVDEVRQAREEYARKFNFDLHAICEDLREKEKLAGGPVVSLPKRPPVSTELGAGGAGTESPAQR